MSFLLLILRNLFRQPVRTGLTVLGISIGITTVIALGVITGGMKDTMAQLLRTGGSDFMVAQEGASDLSFSTVLETEWQAIAARPDVEWAHGMLLHIIPIGSNPYFVMSGITPSDLVESPPPLLAGTVLSPQAADEILLGEKAAQDLNLGVGDSLLVDDTNFRVVGIFRTGTVWLDGGGYAPLARVQQLTSKPDVVTAVYVKVKPEFDVAAVAANIEQDLPSVTAIVSVAEYGDVDQGVQIMDSLNLAISVLAVGIGAIGVMNTMIMSVYERTREIGILRAVGWRGSRILRMVLGESLFLCFLAMGFGLGLGFLAVQGVMQIGTIRSFLQPQYTLDVFIRALAVAVVVALVGAAYPALRAVRLSPMEALRHE